MYRTGLQILEKADTLAFSFIFLKKLVGSCSSVLLELEIDAISF